MSSLAQWYSWGKTTAVNAAVFVVLEKLQLPNRFIGTSENKILKGGLVGSAAALTADITDGILLGKEHSLLMNGQYFHLLDAAAYDSAAYAICNALEVDDLVSNAITDIVGSVVDNQDIITAVYRGVLLTLITLLRKIISQYGGQAVFITNPISSLLGAR
jgi:hypothetical protein